jgi:hypothetical protein
VEKNIKRKIKMYNKNKITSDSWGKVKRILAFITGVSLWLVSIVFSYNGFGISNSDVAWAGAVLAFAVTVLELIFNTNTLNGLLNNNNVEFGEWILVIGGALAYVYDVWTNILGFYVMQGKPAPDTITISFIVPFLFGCLVAILPEPMFVWAMGWNKINPSDSQEYKMKNGSSFHTSKHIPDSERLRGSSTKAFPSFITQDIADRIKAAQTGRWQDENDKHSN